MQVVTGEHKWRKVANITIYVRRNLLNINNRRLTYCMLCDTQTMFSIYSMKLNNSYMTESIGLKVTKLLYD